MTEFVPTGVLADVLGRYEGGGGVIEHILIAPGTPRGPTADVHRGAALFTLDVVTRRTDAYFRQLLNRPEYRDRNRNEFFRVTVDPDRLAGRRVSPDAFLGPHWDRAERCRTSDQEMGGYAYAFLEPPYGLYGRGAKQRISEAEASDLFRAVTDALFAGFPDALTIYEWSTDCSNYFDAGREWWGTYFWTVAVPGSAHLIGVAASTTD